MRADGFLTATLRIIVFLDNKRHFALHLPGGKCSTKTFSKARPRIQSLKCLSFSIGRTNFNDSP